MTTPVAAVVPCLAVLPKLSVEGFAEVWLAVRTCAAEAQVDVDGWPWWKGSAAAGQPSAFQWLAEAAEQR